MPGEHGICLYLTPSTARAPDHVIRAHIAARATGGRVSFWCRAGYVDRLVDFRLPATLTNYPEISASVLCNGSPTYGVLADRNGNLLCGLDVVDAASQPGDIVMLESFGAGAIASSLDWKTGDSVTLGAVFFK